MNDIEELQLLYIKWLAAVDNVRLVDILDKADDMGLAENETYILLEEVEKEYSKCDSYQEFLRIYLQH